MTAEANPPVRQGAWVRVLVRGLVLAAALAGLVAFSVLLAKVTLTPSPASEDLVTSNLRPGRSLRQYAEEYTFLAACKQAGGNVLLGVPFGLLLPFFVPRRLRMIRTTLLAAVAMAVVELIQGALVQGRAFDIDDVILNTTGALLGYFLLGRRISHRYYVYADAPGTSDRQEEPAAEPKPTPKRKPSPKKGTGRTATGKTATGRTATGKTATRRTAVDKTGAGRTGTRKTPARTKDGQAALTKPSATAPAGKRSAKNGGPDDGGRATGSGGVRSLLDRVRRR
ncbi:VanZ family protein [Streptomyces sp. NPDC058375]|uniref:VanZ family protein n=1 Tax=Streptomyces sp. NPDC058375 TaxID=3346467 RepID=UPI00364B8E3C